MNNQNVRNGRLFEDQVYSELLKSSPVFIRRNEKIREIGISVDFYVKHADGSEEFVEVKGGENVKLNGDSWSGATRTDNVKKAICNGALLKSFKDDARYTIYFNQPPKTDSGSHRMIEHAKSAKFVDEVIILTSK